MAERGDGLLCASLEIALEAGEVSPDLGGGIGYDGYVYCAPSDAAVAEWCYTWFVPDMTVTEAAEALGLKPSTLYGQLRRGVLRGRRSGSTWLLTRREVGRYRRLYLGHKDNHRQDFMARFWSKVRRTRTCWLWIGTTRDKRYGCLFVVKPKRRYVPAHRISWELNNGPIPEGMEICHTCDNGLCVRPDHLFLGSRAENANDMARKGRAANGERHGMAKKARITDEMVRDIRQRAANGETQVSLGKEYGVSQHYISRIVNRQRRRHVS